MCRRKMRFRRGSCRFLCQILGIYRNCWGVRMFRRNRRVGGGLFRGFLIKIIEVMWILRQVDRIKRGGEEF